MFITHLKADGALRIGDSVVQFKGGDRDGSAEFEVDGRLLYFLDVGGEPVELVPGAVVYLREIQRGYCEIGINAPRHIEICTEW